MIHCNGVNVSFHPAGHILGSAQIRLEYRGEIWVVSGDYKTAADPTCAAFESVPCHTFITESTFGNPIYQWQAEATIFKEINHWWHANELQNRPSILLCYSLGKAQRLLNGIDASIGEIYSHENIEIISNCYRQENINLPKTIPLHHAHPPIKKGLALITPQSIKKELRKFYDPVIAFASGWMQTNRFYRGANFDKGFALSDHADWPGLLQAINASKAEKIIIMHDKGQELLNHLTAQGLQAEFLEKNTQQNNYEFNFSYANQICSDTP